MGCFEVQEESGFVHHHVRQTCPPVLQEASVLDSKPEAGVDIQTRVQGGRDRQATPPVNLRSPLVVHLGEESHGVVGIVHLVGFVLFLVRVGRRPLSGADDSTLAQRGSSDLDALLEVDIVVHHEAISDAANKGGPALEAA